MNNSDVHPMPQISEVVRRAKTQDMSIQEMYAMATRTDSAFGIAEYKVPKAYVDPLKQKLDVEFAEMRNKGQSKKPIGKLTRRGCYIDDYVKMKKIVPGYLHNNQRSWGEPNKKQVNGKDAKKNTFIDQILNSKNKTPGAGAYNTRKTDEMIEAELKKMKEKRIKVGEKVNYLCDFEYLGNASPGSGNFNPMPPLPKLRENRLKPDDWIKKHKEGPKKDKEKAENGNYTPFPVTYETFGKIIQRMKSGSPRKVEFMGKELRFKDRAKSKSYVSPPAAKYDVINMWGGKDLSAKKEESKSKRPILDAITKGITSSIYYG